MIGGADFACAPIWLCFPEAIGTFGSTQPKKNMLYPMDSVSLDFASG